MADCASVWLTCRHPDVSHVVSRAAVHAITDDSNGTYLKLIFKTLTAIDAGVRAGKWPSPRNVAELDCVLVAIIDDFIYAQKLHSWVGERLHAAWSHVFSNMTSRLPNFSRAVVGWRSLVVPTERFGMCRERWAAIARFLFETAVTIIDWQSGLWWSLQCDTYGREQDMELLRHSTADIAVAERQGRTCIALFFGVPERGETVKTSLQLPNQGVTIDADWVASIFRTWLKRVPEGNKVFSISKQQVVLRVRKAVAALDLEDDDAILHRLRHTGAANDVAESSLRKPDAAEANFEETRRRGNVPRSLEEARRRGRWLHMSSLQRYTKTAHLVADLGKLPDRTRRYGEDFLASPLSFISPPPAGRVSFAAPLL